MFTILVKRKKYDQLFHVREVTQKRTWDAQRSKDLRTTINDSDREDNTVPADGQRPKTKTKNSMGL
jgi:hypothetical protein